MWKFGDYSCSNQLNNLLQLSMKSLLGNSWQQEMRILPQGWDTLQKRQSIWNLSSFVECFLGTRKQCTATRVMLLRKPIYPLRSRGSLFPNYTGLSSCKKRQNWGLQDRLLYSSRLSNLNFPFIANNASNTAHTVPIVPHLLSTGNHVFFKPTTLGLTSLELTRLKL